MRYTFLDEVHPVGPLHPSTRLEATDYYPKSHYFYSYRLLLEILLYFRGNIIPFQQGTKETEGTEIVRSHRVCVDSYPKVCQEFMVPKDTDTTSWMLTWCDAKKREKTEKKIFDSTFSGSLTTSKNILGQQLSLTEAIHSERQVSLPLNPNQYRNPRDTGTSFPGRLKSQCFEHLTQHRRGGTDTYRSRKLWRYPRGKRRGQEFATSVQAACHSVSHKHSIYIAGLKTHVKYMFSLEKVSTWHARTNHMITC